MAFWSRRSKAPEPEPPAFDESHCTLCGLSRAEVTRLVVGERGAVCAECIRESIWALDPDAKPGSSKALSSLLVSMIEVDEKNAPFSRTAALGAAAIELAGGDVSLLRRVGAAAIERSNARLAIEAFSSIPEAQLTLHDRINLSFAHSSVDDIDRATQTLPDVDEADSRGDTLLLLINRASFVVLRTPPPSKSELTDARTDLERAMALCERDTRYARLRGSIEGSLAHVDFLEGDLDSAEARLRSLSDDPHPQRLLLLGDTLLAKGDRTSARRAWRAALDAAHPESAYAAEARRRLEPEYR